MCFVAAGVNKTNGSDHCEATGVYSISCDPCQV